MTRVYWRFLIVLLICALALHTAYSVRATRTLARQAEAEHAHLLHQGTYYTERFLQEIADCANLLYISPRLQQVLIARQKPDYLAFADCRDLLTEYALGPFSLYRLDLYLTDGRQLITSSEGVFYHISEQEAGVYEELCLAGTDFWTAAYRGQEPAIVKKTRNQAGLTYVKQVSSRYTGKPKGVLLLTVPFTAFDALIAPGEGEYSALAFEGQQLAGHIPEGYTVLTRQGSLSAFTFSYAYLPPRADFFSGPFLLILFLILLSFLISFALILGITERKIAGPVTRLLQGFRELEERNFSVRLAHTGDPVFGEMNRAFDHMAQRMESGVAELVAERTRAEELRQTLLMMQIRPHFLYNIFNNMIWLTEKQDLSNLEQLVKATAGFYKTVLENEILLLENEEQLSCYVQIQKFRFGDRFDLIQEVSPEAEALVIPNLLLQPLVENAIVHGFRDIPDRRGTIRLSAWIEERMLHIRVQDNGTGIPQERLEDIRAAMETGNSGKAFFALVNVSQRLKMRYPGKGRITLESREREGTQVTLVLPVEDALEEGMLNDQTGHSR